MNISCGALGPGCSGSWLWAGNSSPCDQRPGSQQTPLPAFLHPLIFPYLPSSCCFSQSPEQPSVSYNPVAVLLIILESCRSYWSRPAGKPTLFWPSLCSISTLCSGYSLHCLRCLLHPYFSPGLSTDLLLYVFSLLNATHAHIQSIRPLTKSLLTPITFSFIKIFHASFPPNPPNNALLCWILTKNQFYLSHLLQLSFVLECCPLFLLF